MADRLTHLDERGRARMVNVGEKPMSHRVCVARGKVRMAPATLERIVQGKVAKGDVLATARIAGIQAAKRTADWVPLAHPLPLDEIAVELSPATEGVRISSRVVCQGRTGAEMEALTACAAAALALYDMVKAVEKSAVISDLRLETKSGGRSGDFRRDDDAP